jgi:hypothetical protein
MLGGQLEELPVSVRVEHLVLAFPAVAAHLLVQAVPVSQRTDLVVQAGAHLIVIGSSDPLVEPRLAGVESEHDLVGLSRARGGPCMAPRHRHGERVDDPFVVVRVHPGRRAPVQTAQRLVRVRRQCAGEVPPQRRPRDPIWSTSQPPKSALTWVPVPPTTNGNLPTRWHSAMCSRASLA